MAKENIGKLKRENELLRLELQTVRAKINPSSNSNSIKLTPSSSKVTGKVINFDFKYLKKDLLKTLILTGVCVAIIISIFVTRMVY